MIGIPIEEARPHLSHSVDRFARRRSCRADRRKPQRVTVERATHVRRGSLDAFEETGRRSVERLAMAA
jgi:hypothetical protein